MSATSPAASAIGLVIACGVISHALTTRFLSRRRVPHAATSGEVPPPKRALRGARPQRISAGLTMFLTAIWVGGPVLVLALAAALAGGARSLRIIRHRHTQQQLTQAIPDALDLVVVLLQAGVTPRETVVELGRRGPGPTRPGFTAVAAQLDQGQAFSDAIGALRREIGDAITPFVEIISASERYGLPTAQVVQQLAHETRALRRRHDEAAARSLPVKLSFPLVMCTLPSFVLLAIAPAVLAALSSLGANAW